MKKHRLVSILGFAISPVLLYFAFRGVQFNKLFTTLKGADIRFAFIPITCIALCAVLCAYRWSKVVGPEVRFRDTFIALLSGLFVNNVLPARIGEVARGYVIAKRRGISFTYALTTVFVDRVFDLVGLLIITFVFLPKHALPPAVSKAIYMLLGLLLVCTTLIIILSRRSLACKVADKLDSLQKPFCSQLGRRVLEIQENLCRISSPLNIVFYILTAVVIWLSMSAALYFTMLMLGVKIDFLVVPFVCALLNMGLTIPSSPGYVGVYQWLLVNLLAIFSVPNYQALAVSIVFQATWYVPYCIVGAVFLAKEHLKLQDIQKIDQNSD